jgi:hypothetical protein
MSNVLDDNTQQQILALGRLGWTLRRIEAATGVRRETVGGYLRAAGLAVRGRGRPGEAAAKPAITGEVSTDGRARDRQVDSAGQRISRRNDSPEKRSGTGEFGKRFCVSV